MRLPAFTGSAKECISENDPTVYKIKASLLTEQDVLFAISSSGRSADIVDAAQIARHGGATVISLCDFAVSPLTKSSNINLYTTPRDTTLFLNIDMPLIIGQISIIDILFSCCCRITGQHAFDMMHTTKKIADKEKLGK
ncbi:MAG: SIS domain-containing protein [candidate division KSB1 bacterium]|nr:SIS domain-containing protein [candidate division KSB1 bacterium]